MSLRHSRFIFFCREDSRGVLCFRGDHIQVDKLKVMTLGALELYRDSQDIIHILPNLPFHKRLT